MSHCRVVTLVAAVSCVLVVQGCASQANRPQEPLVAVFMEPEERLGVEDVFEVRVVGEPDLSGPFRVSADGSVDYPYAGRIGVAGLRVSEVQALITDRLKDGYLKSPQVSVMVKEWNSRKISVLGQVQKPGSVVYFPKMTIVDAIAAAGGFTGIAAKNAVTLRREAGGRVESRSYRVADISEGRSSNVVLLPGDVLVVEERLF